jgi:hypothetical protein
VLKAAVEGKLTKDWREAHQGELEPASVLLERILKERREKWEAEQLAQMKAKGKTTKDNSWKLKYKEPVAPDTSDLLELPEGWIWATVEQVVDVGTGATPLKSNPNYYELGTIPWVTSGALNEAFVTQADEKITELAIQLVFRLRSSDSAKLSRAKGSCSGSLKCKCRTNWLKNTVTEQYQVKGEGFRDLI